MDQFVSSSSILSQLVERVPRSMVEAIELQCTYFPKEFVHDDFCSTVHIFFEAAIHARDNDRLLYPDSVFFVDDLIESGFPKSLAGALGWEHWVTDMIPLVPNRSDMACLRIMLLYILLDRYRILSVCHCLCELIDKYTNIKFGRDLFAGYFEPSKIAFRKWRKKKIKPRLDQSLPMSIASALVSFSVNCSSEQANVPVGALSAPAEAREPTQVNLPVQLVDRSGIELFDMAAVTKRLADSAADLEGYDLAKPDESVRKKVDGLRSRIARQDFGTKKQLLRMFDSGASRALTEVSLEKLDRLKEIEDNFPNFSEPLNLIRRLVALNLVNKTSASLQFRPILMVGPPGVGKTVFARQLAAALETPFCQLDLGAAQAGFGIAGSESGWSNSQPGRVLEVLTAEPVANPLFLLDEIEKTADSRSNYPVLPALLNLLERQSAKHFQDLHIPGVTIDASHILWLATANRLEKLPPELVNRFEVCEIKEMSPEQKRQFVSRDYQRLCSENSLESRFPEALPDVVVDKLATLETRPLLRFLESLLGEMVIQRQDSFEIKLVESLLKERRLHPAKQRASIGFVL